MRRAIGAMVAVAAAAVVAGAAGWASGAADISAPQTMRFTAVFKQSHTVDVDPAGPSLGDYQVGSGVIRHAGKSVGSFAISCLVDAVGGGGHFTGNCTGWGKLAAGYLTFAGQTDGTDHHVDAVTGGTGSYRNARGLIRLTDLSPTKSRAVVELIP